MQHYGFMRIYDAKLGEIHSWTAHLDLTVSFLWYVTFIAFSPQYRHNLLLRAYSSGIPFLSPALVEILAQSLLGLSILATVAYVMYAARRWKETGRFNWRKLATLGIFLGATGYLYIGMNDFTAGFAIWSAFHCLQYYGIVWAFNRNRAAKSQAVSRFVRFLFRPGILLVLAYVGLILAYGGINYGIQYVSDERLRQWLMALVVTSGSLHYYYDGFIWKVRERETSQFLNISTLASSSVEQKGVGVRSAVPVWLESFARSFSSVFRRLRTAWSPGMTQMGYLSAAILVVAALESWRPHSEIPMRQSLVLASPQAGEAYFNLGDAYRKQGRLLEASQAFSEAVGRMPAYALAHNKLSLTLLELGRPQEAMMELEKTIALNPTLREAQYNLGVLLAKQGESARALTHLRLAFPKGDKRALQLLDADPAGSEILNNLALGVADSGGLAEAKDLLERAILMDPRHASAQLNLGNLFLLEGNLTKAHAQFEQALLLNPSSPMAHNNLGLCLVREGRSHEAVPHLQIGLRNGDEAVRASAHKALLKLGAIQ